MNHTRLIIYPTFAIINHSNEIVNKVVALYKNNPDVVAVFENQIMYDFEYFGYNINNPYSKLKKAIVAHGVKTAELTKRNLDAYVYQELQSEQVFLFIPNVQQIRAFQERLSANEKANVKGIYLLNYKKDELVEVGIYTSLCSVKESVSTFASLPEDRDARKKFIEREKQAIESLCNINLSNYECNDSHSTSTVYVPHDVNSNLYKIIRGKYPDLWIEKCKLLTQIGSFLNRNGIPNALPTNVFLENSFLIFEQRYIDGFTLHGMISRRGISDIFKSDSRHTLVDYLMELSHAVYFYHFLGIYISDIKEDNFFYCKYKQNGIIPIDADGFSLYTYSSSQPISKYRANYPVPDETYYYHTVITETYSFSYLIYRILFNNNSPTNDKKEKCLENWNKKSFSSASDRWEKKQLQFWNALPNYIQEIFVFLFCNGKSTVTWFLSDEWDELLYLYRNDLNSPNAVTDYENDRQNVFIGTIFSFANQLLLKYDHVTSIKENSTLTIIKIKKALCVANVASFIAILVMLFRIFIE